MILLEKEEPPTTLVDNFESWTRELAQRIDRNGSYPSAWARNKFGHEEIRSTLETETHAKCMYCESYVNDVSYGNIEHIQPKAEFPQLSFEWSNLGFCCQRCNTEKGDYYDAEAPVVNPYEEDPAEFLVISGVWYFHRPGDVRGEVTIDVLSLNRPGLLEERRRKLQNLMRLLDKATTAENERQRQMARQAIEKEISQTDEYTFCSRHFVCNSHGLDVEGCT